MKHALLLILFSCVCVAGLYGQSARDSISTDPSIPITELDTVLWKGYQGGLYPNRSNTRPKAHDDSGRQIAATVAPLNTSGAPDPANGKIVLLSVGMSNCTQEYSAFKQSADADTMKNPKVLVVDGAQGGQTASIIRDPAANFWTVITQRLQSAGASAAQVQVVWLKEANANPTAPFPVHAQQLKTDLKVIAGLLRQKFPNIRLCYVSGRTYGGYATTTLNPEPYAYETSFSVKWLIEEQINGDDSLSFGGAGAKAPWLAWGPYLWANGQTPRKEDSLTWQPGDVVTSDGTHPSASGRQKVATLLSKFFKTDPTATPWYLKGGTTSVPALRADAPQGTLQIAPNPATGLLHVRTHGGSGNPASTVIVRNLLGQAVISQSMDAAGECVLNLRALPHGLYTVQAGGLTRTFVKQ